ncbi:MAG: nucleotidyl transferase AbiEii/AbiGii toxin family protein [Planctomycetes bacterium]|nr:nucleotidyl transferase AbiEii/AbiGii toxin family protein [Planctomycetota bacterium]
MADLSGFKQPLSAIVEWAGATGHSFALVGGLAVSSHAEPRSTQDIDVLLVSIDEPDELLVSLRPYGFQEFFKESVEIATRSSVLVLLHASSQVKVDVMLARLPIEEDFVGEAQQVPFAGVTVPVITVEHLVLMKLLASRPRDEADVHELVAANPDMDRRKVKRLAAELAEMIEMPELMDQAVRFLGS